MYKPWCPKRGEKSSGLYAGNYGTPQKLLIKYWSSHGVRVGLFSALLFWCWHLTALMSLRCGMKTRLDCFLGCELVDWLLKVGLAQDRGEAVLYGTRLLQGGVLQHIKQEYSFEDGQLHYYFMTWKIQLARSLPQTTSQFKQQICSVHLSQHWLQTGVALYLKCGYSTLF